MVYLGLLGASLTIHYDALVPAAAVEIMQARHEDDNFLEAGMLLVGHNALKLLCMLESFSGRGG